MSCLSHYFISSSLWDLGRWQRSHFTEEGKKRTGKWYKQLIELNNRKIQTTQSKNGQKTWIDIYQKKTYRWPKGRWKNDQLLLEKCKSKLQWGNPSHQSERPSSKNLQITNAGEGWRKGDPPTLFGGNVNWCSLWKMVWRFLKKLKIELPYDPATPLLGIYLDKTVTWKDTCTPDVHSNAIYNSQDTEKTKHPLTDEWIKKTWCVTVCVCLCVCIYTPWNTTQP